jgi:hypothetical protein
VQGSSVTVPGSVSCSLRTLLPCLQSYTIGKTFLLHLSARCKRTNWNARRNEKMIKGEADVLLVDPHGIVQAILEVKTAKVCACVRLLT